jgi:hypothetical protein
MDKDLRAVRIVEWLAVLVGCYLVAKTMCLCSQFPSDCDPTTDIETLGRDVQALFEKGLAIAGVTGVFASVRAYVEPRDDLDFEAGERVVYQLHEKQTGILMHPIAFAATALITVGVWSVASLAAKHSLADIGSWGAAMWILSLLVAAGVGWLIYVNGAAKLYDKEGQGLAFVLYCCIVALVGIYYTALATLSDRRLHMHHYQLAFLVALACSENTASSRIGLAVCIGVMGQGLGTYGADAMLE